MGVALLALLGGVAFLGALAQPAPAGGGSLPPMPIPADNPQTDAKIKLGRQLYSLSQFNRVFKKLADKSPTEFRNGHGKRLRR